MYTDSKHVTRMGLDHSTMPSPLGGVEAYESIRINFNISMLRVPCQYAALQVADHVGSHKMGGARNSHKVLRSPARIVTPRSSQTCAVAREARCSLGARSF